MFLLSSVLEGASEITLGSSEVPPAIAPFMTAEFRLEINNGILVALFPDEMRTDLTTSFSITSFVAFYPPNSPLAYEDPINLDLAPYRIKFTYRSFLFA